MNKCPGCAEVELVEYLHGNEKACWLCIKIGWRAPVEHRATALFKLANHVDRIVEKRALLPDAWEFHEHTQTYYNRTTSDEEYAWERIG